MYIFILFEYSRIFQKELKIRYLYIYIGLKIRIFKKK